MKFGKKTDSGPSVRVAQGTYQKAMVKKLVTQLILVFMALILVYLCFAATIIRVVPSSAGLVPVRNNTYPGGNLPTDAQVLVDLDPEKLPEKTILGRLTQSFVPQKPSALVQVLAGPTGRVKWTGGTVTVDGKVLPATFPTDPGLEFLEDQYMAVCISGDCTPGTAIIFVEDQVIGVPISQDASVPPPAPFAPQGKVNRTDPLNVVGAFIVEGYNGNTRLSCSLLAPGELQRLGGVSACERLVERLTGQLGPNYDFDFNMALSIVSETSGIVRVEAELRVNESVLTGTYELRGSSKGLSIVSVGELKK